MEEKIILLISNFDRKLDVTVIFFYVSGVGSNIQKRFETDFLLLTQFFSNLLKRRFSVTFCVSVRYATNQHIR